MLQKLRRNFYRPRAKIAAQLAGPSQVARRNKRPPGPIASPEVFTQAPLGACRIAMHVALARNFKRRPQRRREVSAPSRPKARCFGHFAPESWKVSARIVILRGDSGSARKVGARLSARLGVSSASPGRCGADPKSRDLFQSRGCRGTQSRPRPAEAGWHKSWLESCAEGCPPDAALRARLKLAHNFTGAKSRPSGGPWPARRSFCRGCGSRAWSGLRPSRRARRRRCR